MLQDTLTVVLAGRMGSRLQPLTKDRALPAVPFGGKYRIIDFTLANCMNTGLRRVLVLTQYKSLSLHRHIRDGWSIFNPELGEYITTVPPQMRTGASWYSGTADAVYQNLYLLERSGARWVLILSGDNIYRMDYAPLITSHAESGSDVTLACREVPFVEASNHGVLTMDALGRVTNFEDKPTHLKPSLDNKNTLAVSMGVSIFSINTLMDVLQKDASNASSSHDFNRDVLPQLVDTHKVSAYYFGGKYGRVTPDRYWRNVDTLDSYYQANMDLLMPVPPINLYQRDWPIRTYQEQSPPCRTVPGEEGTEGLFINSIASSGVVISGGSVQHSILFSNVYVDDQATVEDSLLLNSVHVGKGVRLKRCIIDKNVQIPDGESIGINIAKDAERFTISDKGIVVVPKNYKFS